jgi:hypothetical protein
MRTSLRLSRSLHRGGTESSLNHLEKSFRDEAIPCCIVTTNHEVLGILTRPLEASSNKLQKPEVSPDAQSHSIRKGNGEDKMIKNL